MSAIIKDISRRGLLCAFAVTPLLALSPQDCRAVPQLPEMSLHGQTTLSDLTLACGSNAVGDVIDPPNPREWSNEIGPYNFALGQESPDSLAQYKIPVWVYQHNDRNNPIGEFVVRCVSSGSYIDKRQQFDFTFEQKGDKDRSLRFDYFPFHSRDLQLIEIPETEKITQSSRDPLLSQKEFLAIDKSANIGDGGDNLPLTINSKSTDFPITGEVIMTGRSEDCWEDSVEKFPVKLKDFSVDASTKLTLPVKFETWCALGHSLFHILPQQPDAEAAIDVVYAPQILSASQNGHGRTVSFVYRIRFQPTWVQLVMAAIFGLFIGSGIRYLGEAQKSNFRRNLVEFGAAITAVVVAELVCLIGFMMDKPSTFWSIDLDPHRWLPCFMIALLASGGAAVRTWLKKAKDSISDDHGGEGAGTATPNPGGAP